MWCLSGRGGARGTTGAAVCLSANAPRPPSRSSGTRLFGSCAGWKGFWDIFGPKKRGFQKGQVACYAEGMGDDPNLANAYAVSSQEEMRSLYENWAETYDAEFIEAQGYQMPRVIAECFVAAGGKGPVLDVGAGTGRGGEHLAAEGVAPIDGIDLSEDMLRVAGRKGVYRYLIAADITRPLERVGPYQGIVSAGTFTFGHVGPEGLPALLDVAAPGCLFVLGVNAQHFAESGFEAAFAGLGGAILGLTYSDHRIYDDRADEAHRQDVARVVTFRKV